MNSESPTHIVETWLSAFDQSLQQNDVAAVVEMFTADSYWRDLVSFTWNISTIEGKDAIGQMLGATLQDVQPSGWHVLGEATFADGVTEAWVLFETAASRGKGHLRLKEGRCWTLLTTMLELKGFEEQTAPNRPMGVEHGAQKGRISWQDKKDREFAELGYSRQPYCVIIGGGQGGIGLGARLKQLGVPTIIVEKNERPGDSWRNRYKSLCLHDPVWYDHMPYIPFPEHWPVFSPKDKMGDWLEMYTRVMDLDYWSASHCQQASYDEVKKEWKVLIDRNGTQITLNPKHLVLATGVSGMPHVPEFPGASVFNGEQYHSSEFTTGENYTGKNCIVVGSTNSAHDICADLWEHNANVTMIQRSSALVARSETLMDLVLGDLYSERALSNGIDHHMADLIFASIPYGLLPDFQVPLFESVAEVDAEFYQRLQKAGFLLDWGEDGSGLVLKYLRRGSGYYIDVGASELVADGSIKLESGVNIKEIKQHSVMLTDGKELPADVIVYATGYGPMNGWAAKLISQQVANKVGKCWGLGSDTTKDPGPWEGELRNMWKPTWQEGLWFHGGNLHQSRHYSLYLALQIKARLEGIPTPVYGMQPVHHLS